MTQLRLDGVDDLKITPMPEGWRPDTPPDLSGVSELAFDTEWNDWIIQGVKGELCLCKPDIFETTYEQA